MAAETFLTCETLEIVGLGLIAFVFGTGSGVVDAKIMNLFLKDKINPLIGSAGIASVPIAARVSHIVALQGESAELSDLSMPWDPTSPVSSAPRSPAASCSRCSASSDGGGDR